MPIIPLQGKSAKIHETAWVSPNAYLIGDVEVGPNSVVWPGCILRAEYSPIVIGANSVIFDGVTMITRTEKKSIHIGSFNIIERGCLLFGTFLLDYCVVGENTTIWEDTNFEEGVVLLPNSMVPAGMNIPSRAILKGNPVSQVREQSRSEMLKMKDRAEHYADLFTRVKAALPNLQPYALTAADLFNFLLEKRPPPEGPKEHISE
jgi:carbonic anhydrase/acetyltransferase-like protein (isoleucine patch superfamily)